MDHELLATIAEMLDSTSIRLARLWSKKNAKMPKPLRIPRPYEAAKSKVLSMSDPRARAFFGGTAVRYVPKED